MSILIFSGLISSGKDFKTKAMFFSNLAWNLLFTKMSLEPGPELKFPNIFHSEVDPGL